MANKNAVKFNSVSWILSRFKKAIVSVSPNSVYKNPKTLYAKRYPEQTNIVSTIIFRSISSNRSVYVTFRPSSGLIDPSLGSTVVFRNINEDHTIHVTFVEIPEPPDIEESLEFDMPMYLQMMPQSIMFVGDYIKLLAHMDGSEGSTTLIDHSKYHHNMTAEAGANLTAAGNALSGIAAMFSGSNYLAFNDSPEFDWGNWDFTIDFWAKFDNIYIDTTKNIIQRFPFFCHADPDNPFYVELQWVSVVPLIAVKVGGLSIPFYDYDGSVWSAFFQRDPNWYYGVIPTSTYSHVALVKQGDTTYVFLNGKKLLANGVITDNGGSTQLLHSNLTGVFFIGKSSNSYLKGSMQKFRFSKGIARWSVDFDSTEIDYTVNTLTRMQLPMDGAIGSNIFRNEGLGVFSLTNVNNVVVGNPLNSFGNSSVLLNGIDEFVSVAPSQYWNIGTRDFTIDLRAKLIPDASNYYPLFSYGVVNTANFFSLVFDLDVGKFILTIGTTEYSGETLDALNLKPFTDEDWHHIALVSYLRTVSIYFDGVAVFSESGLPAFPTSDTEFLIGTDTVDYFKGYIDEVRVLYKADWTSNFSIPFEPYDDPPDTPIPSGSVDLEPVFENPMSLETVFRKPGEYDITHSSSLSLSVALPDILIPELSFNIPLQLVVLREGASQHRPFVFSNKWKSSMMMDYSNVPGVEGDYRIALMSKYFEFDPDVHEYFIGQTDSYEIPSVNGYVSDLPIVFRELTTEGILSFEDLWLPTAFNGAYGPINSVMVLDYASNVNGLIVGCIILPEALLNYGTLKLSDLSFQIV